MAHLEVPQSKIGSWNSFKIRWLKSGKKWIVEILAPHPEPCLCRTLHFVRKFRGNFWCHSYFAFQVGLAPQSRDLHVKSLIRVTETKLLTNQALNRSRYDMSRLIPTEWHRHRRAWEPGFRSFTILHLVPRVSLLPSPAPRKGTRETLGTRLMSASITSPFHIHPCFKHKNLFHSYRCYMYKLNFRRCTLCSNAIQY